MGMDTYVTTINNKSGSMNCRLVRYRGSFDFETKSGNIKVVGDVVNTVVLKKVQSKLTGFMGKAGNVININAVAGDINTAFEYFLF